MTTIRSALHLFDDPRMRRWAEVALGLLGWVAVALAYPFAQDVPRYALY